MWGRYGIVGGGVVAVPWLCHCGVDLLMYCCTIPYIVIVTVVVPHVAADDIWVGRGCREQYCETQSASAVQTGGEYLTWEKLGPRRSVKLLRTLRAARRYICTAVADCVTSTRKP